MTTLDPCDGYVILINTFTVDPSRAEELLDLLHQATEETMRSVPGFISANLHVSLDRTHVANYAQWRHRADFESMLTDPAAQVHMRRAAELSEAFDPILYELRHSEMKGGEA